MSKENELPQGWISTKLGDIATIVGGSTPSRKEDSYFGGDIVWLTPTEIPKETVSIINTSRETLTEEGFESCSAPLIPAGSVLFTSRASIGYAAIAGVPVTTNQGFASFILPKSFEPKYLGWWLKSQKAALERIAGGTTFKEISKSTLRGVSMPLPPLAEQQRIVEAIEQQFSRLDAGVAILRQIQKRLKKYRAALLKAAVEGKLTADWRAAHPDTEPASELLKRILEERRAKWEEEQVAKGRDPKKMKYVEPVAPDVRGLPVLPEGWQWVALDQLITYLRNGLPQKPNIAPPGHRILRISAVRPMKVNMDEVRFLDLSARDVESYFLTEGDILFTRYNGSLDLLGVAGMVQSHEQPTLHPDKLIRVRTQLNGIHPPYIELASNVGFSRAFIESKARTTAGQTGISGSDIRNMPIPFPSFAEQQQIVSLVEERLSIIASLEAAIEKALKWAERLRQSILRRAFTGKLVAQDPNDEPASMLLERIKQEREEAARQKREQQSARARVPKAARGKRKSRPERTRRIPEEPGEPVDTTGLEQQSLWQNAEAM